MSKGKAKGYLLTNGIRQSPSAVKAAAIGALLLAASSLTATVVRADAYGGSDSQGQLSSPSKSPAIDLDVVNANLLSVVRALKLQSNAQIVVVSADYQPVTLTVTASLDDVLKYVAQSAGATVSRDSNGVYVFQPIGDTSNAGVTPVSAVSTPAPQTASAPAAPAAAEHWEHIVLLNVDPNFILKMLNDPDGLRDSDPADNPAFKGGSPSVAPVMPGVSPLTEVNPVTGTTVPVQASVPMSSTGYANNTANQANRSYTNQGDQANQGFGGFQPGGQAGGFNPFNPAGGNASTAFPGGAAEAQGANLRPEGIDSIIANEQDNALIVRGTAEGIAELKQIISFLDRAPKQVQIKVEFVTAEVAVVDQFGISFDLIPFPNVDTGFQGGGSPTGNGAYLTYAQGNMTAQLQALLSKTNSKVIAAPIITTTNNTQATIDFSEQIPYQTTTSIAQGSGNTTSSTAVNFLTVENNLTVLPRINGDDSVSLYLTPTLSTPGVASFTGGPPPVSRQQVETYRTVANGETMVIGGLINKTESNIRTSVPFLADLPIIGSLFRTRNLNSDDTELLIFVTPTVLPPIGSGLDNTNVAGTPGAAQGGAEPVGVGIGVTP